MATNVWDRMPQESGQAYEAFQAYLNMGLSDEGTPGSRSLRKLTQVVPQSYAILGKWSSQYHWGERCRAWDTHIAAKRTEAIAGEARDHAKERFGVALVLLKKLSKWAHRLDEKKLKVFEAAKLIEVTDKLLNVHAPIPESKDLAKLSDLNDEELAEYERLQNKIYRKAQSNG